MCFAITWFYVIFVSYNAYKAIQIMKTKTKTLITNSEEKSQSQIGKSIEDFLARLEANPITMVMVVENDRGDEWAGDFVSTTKLISDIEDGFVSVLAIAKHDYEVIATAKFDIGIEDMGLYDYNLLDQEELPEYEQPYHYLNS